MIKHFHSRQFLVFIATGGTAAIINFVSRILLNNLFSYSTSIILAYLLGMLTAFLLAKIFVFKNSNQTLIKSIFFFCAVNSIAILQTWIISMALAYFFFPNVGLSLYSKELAHAVGIIVPVFTSYLGHKHWSFR